MAGMGGVSEAQHQMFEARLKRISRGGPNTAGHVVVGPADTESKPKRPRRARRPGDFQARLKGAIGHVLVAPVSFALGGVAMMLGIVGAHHLDRTGLPELAEAGLLEQAARHQEFLIAGVVVLVFGGLFRLTRGPRKLAVVVGLLTAFILQDAVFASYPDAFTRLMPEGTLSLPELAALPEF